MAQQKPTDRAKLAEERLQAALLDSANREDAIERRHLTLMEKEKAVQKKLAAEILELRKQVKELNNDLKSLRLANEELDKVLEEVALLRQGEESRRVQQELLAKSKVTDITPPNIPALMADPRPYVFAHVNGRWSFIAISGQQYKHKQETLEMWNGRYEMCRVLYSHLDALKALEDAHAPGLMNGPDLYCVFDRNQPAEAVITIWKPKQHQDKLEFQLRKQCVSHLPVDSLTYDKIRAHCLELLDAKQDNVLTSDKKQLLCEFRISKP